jgi:hypothetical protein
MKMRATLATLGVGLGGYGAFRLIELGWDNLVATLLWLAGGVLLHDAILAPLAVAVAALATTLLPRTVRGPAAAGFVVLGSVTLTAVPVLGRFGARADNPTLLDRDYTTGWLLLAAAVLLAVAAFSTVFARRGRTRED